jgi:hypothetical protein
MRERLQVDEAGEQVGYQRIATFPSVARSKHVRWGALLLPFRNRGFVLIGGSSAPDRRGPPLRVYASQQAAVTHAQRHPVPMAGLRGFSGARGARETVRR